MSPLHDQPLEFDFYHIKRKNTLTQAMPLYTKEVCVFFELLSTSSAPILMHYNTMHLDTQGCKQHRTNANSALLRSTNALNSIAEAYYSLQVTLQTASHQQVRTRLCFRLSHVKVHRGNHAPSILLKHLLALHAHAFVHSENDRCNHSYQ